MPRTPRRDPVHEHALSLATMAEAVIATSPSNPVAHGQLVLTHLSEGGTLIRAEEYPRPVLHVDAHGQVLAYEPALRPGGWEARLVQLLTSPPVPPPSVEVTLDLVLQAVREAAVFARQMQQTGARHDPLQRLGMASLHAAMNLRFPLMP